MPLAIFVLLTIGTLTLLMKLTIVANSWDRESSLTARQLGNDVAWSKSQEFARSKRPSGSAVVSNSDCEGHTLTAALVTKTRVFHKTSRIF